MASRTTPRLDKRYINLKVVFTDEDEQKMIEAEKYYVSQFKPEEIKEMIELVTQNKANTRYFRRFSVSNNTRSEFWD